MSYSRSHRTARTYALIPQTRRRAGHTLIEILLALGLSLVILAAAYAALDQHWRYAEAGQRQTERMQVTRALFERMSLDLRSVVFLRHADSLLPTSIGRSIGILGDGRRLVLQIDAPSIEWSPGGRTIRWEMRVVESNPLDGSDAAHSRAGRNAVSETGSFGLARIAGREATLDAETTVSSEDLLAAEVKTIRFRYFAGGSWFDHWDSIERQELPQAVEITIGFRNATEADQMTSDKTQSGECRLIVPVPASEV